MSVNPEQKEFERFIDKLRNNYKIDFSGLLDKKHLWALEFEDVAENYRPLFKILKSTTKQEYDELYEKLPDWIQEELDEQVEKLNDKKKRKKLITF